MPTVTPSTVNQTLETPTLSLALAASETDPLTVAPDEGLSMETDGGVVSPAGTLPVLFV